MTHRSPPAPAPAAPEAELRELRQRSQLVPPPEAGAVVFESRHALNFVHCTLKQPYSKFLLVLDGQARLQGQGIIHWKLDSAAINLAHSFRSDFQEMLFEQIGCREGWELMVRVCLGRLAVRALRLSRRHSGDREIEFRKGDPSAERVASYALSLQTSFYRAHSVSEAAGATGLSRRQFTHLFHQVTGQTWRRHLQNLRLGYAQQMLLQTTRSVIEIAFEAGFENVSSFNRACKEAFGCTPSDFRRQRRPSG